MVITQQVWTHLIYLVVLVVLWLTLLLTHLRPTDTVLFQEAVQRQRLVAGCDNVVNIMIFMIYNNK